MKRPLRVQLVAELTAAVIAAGAGIAIAAEPNSTGSPSPVAAVAQTSVRPAFASGRVLVKFARATSASARAQLERSNHARTVGSIHGLGVHVLEVSSGSEGKVIAALQHSGKVVYAERDGIVHASDVVPNDPYWSKQWGESLIHATTAWGTTTGSSSVVVAVLDTGVNTALNEFAGRTLPGYNFVANSTNVTDDNSHGTAAAGVALAQGNNATGVAGLCWSCDLLPVKVLDSTGGGTDSVTATGITWAVDHGAKILSLSLGGTATSATLANAVSYAQSHGALVVAAAGNNSSSAAFYPAAYPGVLSVAATDQYDALYSYSDFGAWVDVAAPGSNYSTWPSGSIYLFGGTSSATPVVAGLAGLLFSANPSATAADVTNAITTTTDPLTSGSIATGRVNAAKAMALLAGAPPTAPSPSASPTPTPTSTTAPPSPTPSPTATATATSPAPAPTPSAGPTATSVTYGGNVTATSSKSFALTTSGGMVSAKVTGMSGNVTVSIVASGATLASATGASGVSITATVPAGGFTVVVKGAGTKTKFQLSVGYFA
jgi:subtilisin family serine protease